MSGPRIVIPAGVATGSASELYLAAILAELQDVKALLQPPVITSGYAEWIKTGVDSNGGVLTTASIELTEPARVEGGVDAAEPDISNDAIRQVKAKRAKK
jgi:hypothetical protein